MDEEVLQGGIANAGAVVRVGDHVLRPANPNSASIHRFLLALRATGFDGACEPVAIDPDGRERLVFIPGEVPVPPFPEWAQTDGALASVAELLLRFHNAARTVDATGMTWSHEMADPVGGTVVCHNDVCLENVVFRDGVAIALLDFDFAAPGRPIYDLGALARMCVPIDDDRSAHGCGWGAVDRPRRLRVVADAYGLDATGRHDLFAVVSDAVARSGEFVRRRVESGDRNFIAQWEAMGGAERFDRRRRWWAAEHASFEAALR